MKNVFTVLILAAASLSAAAQNCPVGIVSGQDSVRGMQFGVVASVAGAKARGVQLSGFSNMTTGSLRGVQLSGVSNIAAGVEKDTLPPRLLRENLKTGPATGKVNELQVMLKEYYAERGWDEEGIPTPEKLEQLSIE